MHPVTVRKEIVDRVLKRRGRYHLFDRLDPARTALVVIDMQTAFCAPGGPAEVPVSRDIVERSTRSPRSCAVSARRWSGCCIQQPVGARVTGSCSSAPS